MNRGLIPCPIKAILEPGLEYGLLIFRKMETGGVGDKEIEVKQPEINEIINHDLGGLLNRCGKRFHCCEPPLTKLNVLRVFGQDGLNFLKVKRFKVTGIQADLIWIEWHAQSLGDLPSTAN